MFNLSCFLHFVHPFHQNFKKNQVTQPTTKSSPTKSFPKIYPQTLLLPQLRKILTKQTEQTKKNKQPKQHRAEEITMTQRISPPKVPKALAAKAPQLPSGRCLYLMVIRWVTYPDWWASLNIQPFPVFIRNLSKPLNVIFFCIFASLQFGKKINSILSLERFRRGPFWAFQKVPLSKKSTHFSDGIASGWKNTSTITTDQGFRLGFPGTICWFRTKFLRSGCRSTLGTLW